MTTNEQLAVKLFEWEESEYYDRWCSGERVPQWDSTWQGAGEVIEAMINKGFLLTFVKGTTYASANFKPNCNIVVQDGKGPEAIAEAALAALKSDETLDIDDRMGTLSDDLPGSY